MSQRGIKGAGVAGARVKPRTNTVMADVNSIVRFILKGSEKSFGAMWARAKGPIGFVGIICKTLSKAIT